MYFSNKHLKNWGLMKDYFKNSNEYIITNNFDDFYKDANYLIQNNYIKIEFDTINNYSSMLNSLIEKIEVDQNNIVKMIFTFLFS